MVVERSLLGGPTRTATAPNPQANSWRGVAPGFGVRVHYPIGLVHVFRVSVFSCFRVFVILVIFAIFVFFVSWVTYAALRDTLGAS